MERSLKQLKDEIWNDMLLLMEVKSIYHNYHQATGDRRYRFVCDMISIMEKHYRTLTQMDIWEANE